MLDDFRAAKSFTLNSEAERAAAKSGEQIPPEAEERPRRRREHAAVTQVDVIKKKRKRRKMCQNHLGWRQEENKIQKIKQRVRAFEHLFE